MEAVNCMKYLRFSLPAAVGGADPDLILDLLRDKILGLLLDLILDQIPDLIVSVASVCVNTGRVEGLVWRLLSRDVSSVLVTWFHSPTRPL